MWTSDIPLSVSIIKPPPFVAKYTCTSLGSAETWSWYAEGEKKDLLPHFTVGSRDDGREGWYRFHISVPIASGGGSFNAHLFYIINSGNVTRRREGFTNADELPSRERAALETTLDRDGALYDELAYAFYRGAKSGYAVAHLQKTGLTLAGKKPGK